MDANNAFLPWPALLTMSAVVFLVVSGEMMPTAVLPELAADLGVSPARAGLLVSAWAATVVVASFPLARLTARFDRSRVIVGALVLFAVATLLMAAAPTYGAALGARLVAAGATGLLWSTINAHAASIVPDRHIARAASIVLFGGMLGTVGGIPVGNALATHVGWRVPFLGLGVLALVAAAVAPVVLARFPTAPTESTGNAASAEAAGGASASGPRRALQPLLVTAALGGLVLVAHFMAFTFVAELLAPSTVPTPVLLFAFGLVGAGGVALVGATSDRFPGAVPVVVAVAMTASLVLLPGIGRSLGLDLLIVLAWGLAAGAVGPAIQARIMRAAGTAHRLTAGALIPVAMNLGIAVGSAVGSGAVDRWSADVLPLLAPAPAVAAVLGFLLSARRATGRGAVVAPEPPSAPARVSERG